MPNNRRGAGALVVLVALSVSVAARAQDSSADEIDANLNSQAQRLDQVSRQLTSQHLDEETLDAASQTLLQVQDQLASSRQAIALALDEPNQRLRQLGPPPGDGEPPESPDIARLRETLTKEVSRLKGLETTAELANGTVDDLLEKIRSRKRAVFLYGLKTRTSPFSADLWTQAIAQSATVSERSAKWWGELGPKDGGSDLALLLAALGLAIAVLLLPRGRRWRQFETKVDEKLSPSTLDKRERAARRSLSRAVLATSAGALLYWAALQAQVIGPDGQRVGVRIWLGAASLVFVWNWTQTVLSPGVAKWRIIRCGSPAARYLQIFWLSAFAVFVADRILTAALDLAGAGTELQLVRSMISTLLFTCFFWGFLSPQLWQSADDSIGEGTSSDVTTDAVEAKSFRVLQTLRSVGRALSVLFLLAVVLGYLRVADFAFHRVALSMLFFQILWSLHTVASWGLAKLPASAARITQIAAEGQRDARGEPLSFWLKLSLDLTLFALGIPGFMLIVGFDWLDVRLAFDFVTSDIQIGAVSFSFLNVLTGFLVFLLISAGTRWATSVVDQRLSQQIHMEAGARASIKTLVNYTGLFVGILVALPIAGMSFSRIAVIAGALSVGIGLGLQNIVNNFVSGLILLFERPIKNGDWIVVQSGEGYVKRIGVRATEIMTFDRATIMVPNSELVSSSVRNWFYRNRVGRIRIPVRVAYCSDPEQVRKILIDCAGRNPAVLPHPTPHVVWTEFADSSINFELRAYIRNYDDVMDVSTDLRFAIFKALGEAGVNIPFPQRDVHMIGGA